MFVCEIAAISRKKNALSMLIADKEVSLDIKDVDLMNYVKMDPEISLQFDIINSNVIDDLNFKNPFLGSCQN
jgi:hypothetical protein